MKKTLLLSLLWAMLTGLLFLVLAVAGAYFYFRPSMEDVNSLKDIHLQVPLRIYSADNKLIAEFGEKRRNPVLFQDIPKTFTHAFMAAEDHRFYQHYGIDPKGLVRAALQLVTTGHIISGGSTITMQVAKNFFLTNERTFMRKFTEIFLALEIEQKLSKDEIFELYLNKIYLGNRAYGIGAAAQTYYGKNINELSLAQMAMLAGLPKAPSRYNPIASPVQALARRNWILLRMQQLGYINEKDYQQAIKQPITASYHSLRIEAHAPYVAEMARDTAVERFGPSAYTDGYKIYTTLDSKMQNVATQAVRNGLISYDKRHGYRGPEAHLTGELLESLPQWQKRLDSTQSVGKLLPAAVVSVGKNSVKILLAKGKYGQIPWSQMQWASPYLSVNRKGKTPSSPDDVLKVGDLIRVKGPIGEQYVLSQIPKIEGALVSLDPADGAVKSLVGGFSFRQSAFNRITQAKRQVGSLFKPFVYSAGLEQGFTAATIINDAPVVFKDKKLNSLWRPRNDSGRFLGPTRLRVALYSSRNLATIRLLQALGINKTIEYISRFGFAENELPHDLSLALGSASLTPLHMAKGFAILANGGYLIEPYVIERIEKMGRPVFQADPAIAPGYKKEQTSQEENLLTNSELGLPPKQAEQVMDPRVNYIIQSIMRDVIKRGTGRRALTLKRKDIAGKTGTTNEQKDLWFSGFNSHLVATVWVGFDQPQPLGRREYGSNTPLPIWMDFMKHALANRPEALPLEPKGLVRVRIDPDTGQRSNKGIFEIFRQEHLPKQEIRDTEDSDLSTDDIF